ELSREPVPVRVTARFEVDGRIRVIEAFSPGSALDLVAAPTALARESARLVEVAAAVENVDADLPRRRQVLCLVRFLAIAAEAAEESEAERDERREASRRTEDARPRIPRRARLDRQTGEPARLILVDPERSRVQEGRDERVIRAGEAVDAALFKPVDLVGREPG